MRVAELMNKLADGRLLFNDGVRSISLCWAEEVVVWNVSWRWKLRWQEGVIEQKEFWELDRGVLLQNNLIEEGWVVLTLWIVRWLCSQKVKPHGCIADTGNRRLGLALGCSCMEEEFGYELVGGCWRLAPVGWGLCWKYIFVSVRYYLLYESEDNVNEKFGWFVRLKRVEYWKKNVN